MHTVEDYAWPAYQGRKPFAHQKTTVAFLLSNKRAYVLNDMGTGKTLSALWAVDILKWAGKIRRVLVIGPISTMKSVWYNEVMMNLPHLKAVIAHGSPAKRLTALRDPSAHVVIINHDGIKSCEDEIVRQQFDIVIIDELTAFKNFQAERTKCAARITAQVRGAWGMTGDATPNAPTEAFGQCRVINPSAKYLPRYFGQFRDACMVQINEMLWRPKPEAPNVVAMVMQPSIRFTREQCLDLPETTYQSIEVDLTPEQREAYDRMKREAYVEAAEGKTITAQSAAIVLNKLLQISSGAVKTDDGTVHEIGCEPKMDALFEIFEQTPQRKLVVFATYRATIHMLEKEMERRKVRGGSIYGDVNQNKRAQLIDQFQNGDLQILVLQPQSAAHGITLTAASTIVWFSLIASNEYYNQGNARIVRPGQTRKTQIIALVGTAADKHVAAILERKGELSKETLKIFRDQLI